MSIINFVKMDFLAFKQYRKYYALFLIQFIFMFVAGAQAVSLCALMNIMLAGILPNYLFAGEDKSKMARLYAALPIRKQEVVLGRYLGGVVIGLGIILVTALLLTVDSMITSAFPIQDAVNGFSLSTGIFLIFMSLQFPLLFRFGFIKAQNFTMTLPGICFLALQLFFSKAYYQAMNHLSNTTAVVFLLIGFACIAISLWSSNLIYQAKEQ